MSRRYARSEAVEYTSFSQTAWSPALVVRYARAQDNVRDRLVYIRALSGGQPFLVRESQLRRRRVVAS